MTFDIGSNCFSPSSFEQQPSSDDTMTAGRRELHCNFLSREYRLGQSLVQSDSVRLLIQCFLDEISKADCVYTVETTYMERWAWDKIIYTCCLNNWPKENKLHQSRGSWAKSGPVPHFSLWRIWLKMRLVLQNTSSQWLLYFNRKWGPDLYFFQNKSPPQ